MSFVVPSSPRGESWDDSVASLDKVEASRGGSPVLSDTVIPLAFDDRPEECT
ncbi:MAG: hypothetical protein ACOX8V_03640 [Thermoleophilia bacterium]